MISVRQIKVENGMMVGYNKFQFGPNQVSLGIILYSSEELYKLGGIWWGKNSRNFEKDISSLNFYIRVEQVITRS